MYVVDDDPGVRASIDSLLRSEGFQVATFGSAQEFLRRKPTSERSCLVLDVSLPGLSGLDLQHELIGTDIRIPIIFVTGYGDVPTSVRAMKAGAVEFLTKPFEDRDLLGAIRNALQRGEASTLDEDAYHKELEAAARVQQGLMGGNIPQVRFARITAMNLPCTAVGGDFYSVVTVDDRIVVAIADVAGKGVPAAVMSSLLQGMIQEGVQSKVPLPDIARSANQFFCERELGARYATFVVLCIESDGRVEYLNCAHVPPVVVRTGGAVHRLREANLPVGLIGSADYHTASLIVRPSDRLILVTDGVTEAESPQGEFFGDQRLEESAASGSTLEQIFTSVRQFCADCPLSDDCTLIEAEYLGANA